MPFRSALIATLAFAVFAVSSAFAQPEPQPKDGRVTIAVTLSPNTFPKPISRAYLLPEFSESIQGNRVQMFLRCFMEQDNLFGRAESERRQKWNEMPLKELRTVGANADKEGPHRPFSLKDYAGGLVDRDMYDAARMTNVDWQLWYFVRRDGYYALLPDVQKMRALADVLKTRVRAEIAVGDFPAALHTLKTFFGLARTMEAHPTLIGHLVGVAIATIAVNAVEEFIQQPGAPNLYWALTDLPAPLLSLRYGLEGERLFVSHDFDEFKTAADPVNDAVLLKKIDGYEVILKMQQEGNVLRKPAGDWKSSLQKRAKDEGEVKAARARLIEAGMKSQLVAAWSPLHVVLLDDVVLFEQHRDEVGKTMNLTYWRGKPFIDEEEARLKKDLEKTPLLTLVPAIVKVKQAQTRLDQRVAYLQIMEAIRLHAHENGGKLPATLSEIKLPLPVDPVTGKSFEYSVNDEGARLHGANPNAGNDRTNRYYEIRLQK